MRYSIQQVTHDKDHAYLANQTLWYLHDSKFDRLSLGCYLTEERAKYWCDKLNFDPNAVEY